MEREVRRPDALFDARFSFLIPILAFDDPDRRSGFFALVSRASCVNRVFWQHGA
jgi:hypothetical protein